MQLHCHSTRLTSLDVTKNTLLTGLYCNSNQLTSLDVTKNVALTRLRCSNNLLSSLDVTKNTLLGDLDCWANQLTSLDVSKNTLLEGLYCGGNPLTILDVTKNVLLESLFCWGNGNLRCIIVNDIIAASTKVGWLKDETASYVTVCFNPEINIQGNLVDIISGDISPSVSDDTDFGNVALGTSVTKTFTIQNTGSVDLNITNSILSGSGFSFVTPPPAVILGGGLATFSIKFTPADYGNSLCTIFIENNDSDENLYTFTLKANTICTTYPTTPIVTNNLNYCIGDVAQPIIATGNNLKWYDLPNGGVGNVSAPTPITTTSGIFNYYVTQTIGLCESERSVVRVEVQSSPKPVVSDVVNYCKGNSANPLSATGSNLKWYTSPNAGVASTTAPVPITSISGIFLYYVSQQTTTCESERVAVVVNVNPSVDVPVVISPLDYCVGSTASPLVASGSNLKWYTTQNGTTYSSLAITPSTSTMGTTNYYVSQSYNGCESIRSSIAVNIQQAPSAPTAVSPVNYCLGSVASPLSAVGSNLYWYASSASCSGSGMSPLPSTSITGLTSYFVSQKLNGCESPKKEIVVAVTNSGAAPIVVSPISVFVGVNASALTASGTNLKWYSSATDNIGTTVAPIPSTAVAGMTDYYVSQTINGCESARALIKVLVNGDISAPTCFNLGGTYPFELSPVNTVNATNYTWWVNGSIQSISASSNSPKAIISVGQNYTTGQVCAGINYNQAPWYKQVCTTIDLCANASSRIGGVAPISFVNVSPNPTFDQFSIKASNNVQQVTIKNMLGQNVYTIGDMSTGQTVNFGTELATGMYIIQYKISDGSSHTVSIIKQ